MKYLFFILVLILTTTGCKQQLVDKPDNLIPPDKMEQILYDVSLLNAIKGVDVKLLEKNKIEPQEYLYQKYHIDSLQFSESSIYYASDNPEEYAKIFERIKTKLEKESKAIQDSIDKSVKDKMIKNKR